MTVPPDPDGKHRPDYPPKTPPPPKKPVEAPRPQPAGVAVRGRPMVTMANRRGSNWTLEAQPWSAPGARRRVLGKLRDWGYPLPDHHRIGDMTVVLVKAALGDGGARISVHLADQDQQALILVLSHQPGHAPVDDALLHELAGMGVVSCGADTDLEDGGRRRWALVTI